MKLWTRFFQLTVLSLWVPFSTFVNAAEETIFLEISDVPQDGFIICPVDLTPAVRWFGKKPEEMVKLELFHEDIKINAYFVPGGDSTQPARGTLVAKLPEKAFSFDTSIRLRLHLSDKTATNFHEQNRVVLAANSSTIVFDTTISGGLPSRFEFSAKEQKILETLQWHDRLHDPKTGGWSVSNDKTAKLELFTDSDFCSVVQLSAKFVRPDGSAPPSHPRVVYQWFFFPKLLYSGTLTYVIAELFQDTAVTWQEKHLLELHIPDGSFAKWTGSDAFKSGEFTGSKQSHTFSHYAAMLDDANNMIAMIAPGSVIYDGLREFGPYLLPRRQNTWQNWNTDKHHFSTWLWFGNHQNDSAKVLQTAFKTIQKSPYGKIVIPDLELSVQNWKEQVLNDLFLCGKITSKEKLQHYKESKKLPENWFVLEDSNRNEGAKKIGMILEKTTDEKKGEGLRLLSLVDVNLKTNTILSASDSVPIFNVEVFDKATGKTVTLTSDSGWREIAKMPDSDVFLLRGVNELPEAGELQINVTCHCSGEGAIDWRWQVAKPVERYEFRSLAFPQIALRNLGSTMHLVYPQGSGILAENPCRNSFQWQASYPSGWCSMQWLAAYDTAQNTGLYISVNDSLGSYKKLKITADEMIKDSMLILWEHFLPAEAKPSAQGHWQILHGDWFDAAMIYRRWMRESAAWFPKTLGMEGRSDTPLWMRELSAWASLSALPDTMPESMRQFTESLDVPTGLHWYNWHQIPFDNDYPHYFPAREGFADAVQKIQQNGNCFVMPYINGRLWDTRDKGMEDFRFSSTALPAATKNETGEPFRESYGSKESDGSDVRLAVMCPSTELWKNKVKENVNGLLKDCGTKSVYIDQVAAAGPVLCRDPSHHHLLGGGSWWNQAYWEMMKRIRQEMPKDCMLTTECNAEPFIHVFDGYLTWHWQNQNQVPAFPAIYGGTIQMFGRAYRGGASQVLADRMKAGQQLVFGEQIGWMDPEIVKDARRFPFFKSVVQIRHHYREYFYKGEMCRPPKLLDKIPEVTADWQWAGETIITTDAVNTGAWRQVDNSGQTKSVVLLFVNVSEKPVTSRVRVDLAGFGIQNPDAVKVREYRQGKIRDIPVSILNEPLTFEPGAPLGLEIVTK
jgi:hypothetical protein